VLLVSAVESRFFEGRELAPKTAKYLSGRTRAPLYSYARAQPLEPFTQKALAPGLKIADPIYAPPKREDIVKNLLAALSDTLAAEELLFARLAGDKEIPPFEKPEPPKSSDYLAWQAPLNPGDVVIPMSDRTHAEKAFLIATEREAALARERLQA
jgi:hypothetical protein